jgi:hypothetical protein
MDLVKAFIFFSLVAFDTLVPASSVSRISLNYPSRTQVLGENTRVITATRASEIKESIKNPTMTASGEARKKIQHEIEREKTKKERDQYKSRLEHIKDMRKKQAIMAISNKIALINGSLTSKLKSTLDTLTAALTNMSSKTSSLAGTYNTTHVETAITKAQTLLTDTQARVLAQASREYVLDLASDEAQLKGSVTPIINAFHQDMYHTHQAVIEARDEVVKVYKALHELISVTPMQKL